LVISLILSTTATAELEIKITPDIESVKVMHNGKEVIIKRNQDPNNMLNPEYAKTSRPCPNFCIRPMKLAPGVETVGELEVLDYLKKIHDGDDSILVIDSRTPEWVIKGSIPGAINIPWDVISGDTSGSFIVTKALEGQPNDAECKSPILRKIFEEQLGVEVTDKGKNFDKAKTLVLFCNGPWCRRSPSNIRSLLEIGYPPEKLKWYRGGMQAWELFGLTTVTDIPMPWLGL
jgi:rhodanese-related sulfurtransferase